ncbi:MAG: HTTM domain-containing protein [Bacteroidota bacterium]
MEHSVQPAPSPPETLAQRLSSRLSAPADPVVLGVFRIGFGLVMAASLLRFLLLGWAVPLYVDPVVRFSYPGFDWIQPLPAWALYTVLIGSTIAAALFAIGKWARLWLALFVAGFTYVELIDATTYLNHYYFVTSAGLLMLLLPMGSALVPGKRDAVHVPAWTIWALRLQIGLVYFFAGVAKLHPDWLIEAMPLRIWLAARGGLPVIGPLLDLSWMPWAFSWAGAAFDLLVPFFLLYRKTRPWAYAAAVVFHLATYVLFNIGVFPFVMIIAALVFFESDQWRALGRRLGRMNRETLHSADQLNPGQFRMVKVSAWARGLAAGWLLVQLLLPLRHWLYPGDRLWTEEGFRFAWHVMVAEKTGTAAFHVYDPDSHQHWTIIPSDDLTALQEKQMAFQPDLIWQYAQHVESRFIDAGYRDVEVRAETYVSVNGRPSRLHVNPSVDLTSVPRSLGPKSWILRD